MKRFFNPCERHHRDICLLAAGALPKAEIDAIENHLAACADCRKYQAEITAVTAPLNNWEENFAHLQPSQLAQNRWARVIQATARPEPVIRLTPAMAFHNWCRDVFWPYRRVWMGLATVWLLIAAVNVSQHDHSSATIIRSTSATEMASFRDQQKLLNELLADRSLPVEADRPKAFSPKPRTEALELLNT